MATIGQQLTTPESGWKRYDDNDPLIQRSGSWSVDSNSSTYGGSVRYSRGTSSTISFRFFGSKIRLIAAFAPGQSTNVQVLIDNVPETFSALNTAIQYQTLLYEKVGLTSGIHTVIINNTTSADWQVDAIDIDATGSLVASIGSILTSPESGWNRYDDKNSYISYSSGWVNQDYSGHYLGSSMYTQIMGSSIYISFVGTKFRIIANTWSNRDSSITITIDGISETFSEYTTADVFPALVYEKLDLPSGVHQVEIKKTQSGSGVVHFDAIDIDDTGSLLRPLGSQITTPDAGWKRYDQTNSLIRYVSGWSTNTNSSAYGGSIYDGVAGATTEFIFRGTKLRIVAYRGTNKHSNNKLSIDGITYNFSENGSNQWQTLVAEVSGLEDKLHAVKIEVGTDYTNANIDAIDIDEQGYLTDGFPGESSLGSHITIPLSNGITSSLLIRPHNKMTGIVNIIGSGKSTISANISVKNFREIPSKITVFNEQVIEDPIVPPRLGNQKRGNIFVPYRSELISQIGIMPRNKMTGRVEIIQPPSYKMQIVAIKDAFVRSKIPTLNYGTEQTTVVGTNESTKEIYRSLFEFDLSSITEDIIIEKITLNLYSIKGAPVTQDLGVYSAASPWEETGVTWINQPAVLNLNNIVTAGKIQGYNVIDVTDQVLKWLSGSENNYGFIVKAINESTPQVIDFYTRESATNKPILEITYKLKVIYSIGRTQLNSKIFVNAVGESALKSSLKVNEFGTDRNFPSRIHVLNFNYWLEANMQVSKPDLVARVLVSRTEPSDILSSISVRVKGGYLPQDNLQGKVTVSAPDRKGRILIPYRSDLPSTLSIQRYFSDNHSINGRITISRNAIKSTLRVKQKEESVLQGAITLRHSKTLPSKIIISKPDLSARLEIKYSDQISGSIHVFNTDELTSNLFVPHRNSISGDMFVIHASHLPSSMFVLSNYFRANIVIPAYAENNLIGKTTVRVRDISEIRSTMFVGGDNIPGGFIYIF